MHFPLSSKSTCSGVFRRVAGLLAGLWICAPPIAPAWELPFWRVAMVTGAPLACLRGAREGQIILVACAERCEPIPWQLDERDAAGDLVLDQAAEPGRDDQPGVVDDNDEILWMAADGGRRIRAEEVPADASCRLELATYDREATARAYAFVVPPPAARSPRRYVAYDPATDTVSGARVALGFGAPTPRLLALRAADGQTGPNLLDRLKVRASARFLGIIPLGRDEDDIEWIFGGWRAGPIRVVRREWQWVRLGWGLRTPIFRTETLVYRDWIELPVRLRLNYPPSFFFRAIEVQAALDFRDLRGWHLSAPGLTSRPVGTGTTADAADDRDADWLALEAPQLTFVLRLQLGASLSSLRSLLLFRENAGGQEPEAIPGELPAVGFRLTEWNDIDRGEHGFAAISYALPAGYDLEHFRRQEREPFTVEARALELADPPALR
jgi:hypothetical protein